MKFNRQNKTLEINHWYFETGIDAKALDMVSLAKMFDDFLAFLGADDIVVMGDARNRTFIRKVLSKTHMYKEKS